MKVLIASPSVAEQIYKLLTNRGPMRRHEIAAALGKTQSNCYGPLIRNPHLFRRDSHDSRKWCLVACGESSDEQIQAVSPLPSGATSAYPGSEYDVAESLFLSELARWRSRHRKNFVTPIEVVRILRALGWQPPTNRGPSDAA
jgi:hypothetical protein